VSGRGAGGALAVTALLAAGCGGGDDEERPKTAASVPPAGAAVGPGTVQVRMKDGRFVPARVRAKVGQVVVWVNQDDVAHTVTARSGPRFTSGRIKPKSTFTYRVGAPGTIAYVSRGRDAMRGAITVVRP
jgi:plastocyanin